MKTRESTAFISFSSLATFSECIDLFFGGRNSDTNVISINVCYGRDLGDVCIKAFTEFISGPSEARVWTRKS